ncbi:cysteine desulfurase family protein [Sphingomonas baiyangensis]|uniref:Cysteine desulfurase n=1 Tax=Sphingomonas baiyangensis TaxID=2572576 RepID=A0A4U1L7H7_9SPHN|nr:aminotransferase class V-fold PLP-dependent enzyme [Sphingomonas baiyangensis]TKD52196.1 aminotransferase class V-fold PLP-dependent enzyme [Sphingomonas baiyangensis]
MSDRINLDHAATTPVVPAAAEAMAAALASWANPSSPHAEGRAARAAIERARARIAAAYGWDGEVILTSGATEAIEIACRRAQVAGRMASAVEHDAVLRALPDAPRIEVDGDGVIDLAALEAALAKAETPALVAVQWGNNETGVLQPIAAVAAMVHRAGGLLLVDAAQMPVGWDDEDLPQDHADFISVSGHKRGGPPGIGALLVRDLAMLLPSGGQERGYRGGTENVPGAAGFQAALDSPEDLPYMAELRERLDAAIAEAGGERIAPDAERRTPLIASYRMPGVAAATQLIRFDLAGIAVSAGAACSSGSMRPSHVLARMGIGSAEAAQVVRVSFGRATGKDDIDRFVETWRAIAADVAAQTMTDDLTE